MAILKIARMGHPVLHGRAEPVADPAAPEVRRLVADMIETMDDAPGVGLAAPQVHVAKRVVVFQVPAERATAVSGARGDEDGGAAEDGPQPLIALINPVIEPLGEETELGWEGCLSLPDMIGLVPRYTRIRYRALAPDGSSIERTAAGFHARVVQHECDHLDGILYPMRIADLSQFGYADEMKRRLEAVETAL